MATTNLFDIKQELVVFLRNQDIITASDRGITTEQDTGTFSGDTTYTVATNPTLLKNIRNIEVGGNDLTFGVDYTVNYNVGEIAFTVAQTGAYVIDYDQGATDRIFPDYPQAYLTLTNFPRIAVDIVAGTTNEQALGGTTTLNEFQLSIVAYDKSQTEVEEMISRIREAINDNKKNFYYVPFYTLTGMGPMIISPFGENKIVQRNQDAIGRFVFDTTAEDSTPSTNLLTDLLAYYKMEETSGTVMADETNTYNGVSRSITHAVTGKINLCYGFIDNSDCSVGTDGNDGMPNFNGTSDHFSISWWVYPTGSANYYVVSRNGNYNFRILNGVVQMDVGVQSHNSTQSIPLNQWSHLVGIFDGTNVKIYVDGILRYKNSSSGPTTSSYNTKFGVRASGLGGTAWFNGRIDEVGFWERALTDGDVTVGSVATGEIAELYNSGAGKTYPFT